MKESLPTRYNILLIVLVLLAFYALYSVGKAFFALPSETSATIIAAVSTILVSVLSVAIGKYYERKRVIENELREKKIPMYEEFIEFNFKLLFAGKTKGKKMSEQEMVNFYSLFNQKLIVWGSDEVVNLWSVYRGNLVKRNLAEQKEQGKQDEENEPDEELSSINLMFHFENLLMAIRKDIGHKNKDITQGALLRLFINDMDKYEKKS